MPNWGNPESAFTNASSGPGQGGGIGDASGGGIGNGGDGPGLGPGKGGGTGGDEFMAGTHGNGFPVCIYCPNPQYSEEAVKTKYQGVVMLLVTITADGRVTNIRVSKGLGVGLDEMAIAALCAHGASSLRSGPTMNLSLSTHRSKSPSGSIELSP